MNSSDLGDLFEKASIAILKELFEHWGYNIEDSKIQDRGSQHGFDLYFKISLNSSILHIFVECKASQTDNSIPGDKLRLKLQDFDWATFPDKDIHIFFSPSKEINLNNQLPTIEDDSYPFVIVDWMRKAGSENLILELFAAYRDYGKDRDVLDYCDFLLSKSGSEPETIRTFAEVCEQLKRKFDARVAEHNGKLEFKNFRIINGTFWSEVRKNTHSDFISYFYTKTDSTPARLREVVANDFYVKNIPASANFDRRLKSAVKTRTSLIKIISRGGEGKSTFLYHLAKTYCEDNIVLWLEDTSTELLVEIESKIKLLNPQKPLLFFLDNPAVFGRTLKNFAEKLTLNFRSRDIVFIVAERDIRYEHIEEIEGFEALFDEPYEIRYYANKIREDVFDKLISALDESNSLSDKIRDGARKVFIDDNRKSLAEGAFAVLKYLYARGELKGYKFDWEDWEKFTKEHRPELENLYLIVATFYQFGFSLDIEFCVSLIHDSKANFMTVNSALTENPNLPIYKKGRHLLLRHETIASWYLDGETEKTKTNLENSLYIFKTFLETVDTPFARDLFIWVCLKSQEFRNSEYAKLLGEDTVEKILTGYIEKDPDELKSRTELSKIYQKRGRWNEAVQLLKEYLDLDPQGLHPRTELSKIHQKRGRWDEAESILLELKDIDPNNLPARTELGKIYQKRGRWEEAESILLESLNIDNRQLHPRTELSKIYQKLGRWEEAESILLESLNIDNQQLHPRTELSKVYQVQKKWADAERLLKEYIELEPDGLHPRTELSKIYQEQKKWKEAEDILLELKSLDPDNLQARTELSKIYQKQKRWREAEDILLELKNLDPDNLQARTELSKIYQAQQKWKEAEDILLESLKIDDKQLHPRTELSKIYQAQKKWREAEDILLELKNLDPHNLQARTELSKIYQVQKKWREAEDILLELKNLDPDNLQARTELSKIYQAQKKWKEAEDILLECIKIDATDLNSRTELSKVYQKQNRLEEAARFLEECLKIKPDDGFFKLELGSIYERTGDFPQREKLLFEIYGDHPENIPTLTQLAHLFRRFKKYRIAVKLLEKAFEVNRSDLLTVYELIQLYSILRDRVSIRFYSDHGERIVTANPYNKYRGKFERINSLSDQLLTLIDANKVGYAAKLEDKRYIKSDMHLYEVPENGVFNNQIKEGDKVFFGLYSRDGQLFANFIEPYFESIDDLKSLK